MSGFQEIYKEKIYSGVLGKIIGVYLGIPVEGWDYEDIKETYGEIYSYIQEKTGETLIVADDDISGTFGFFKTVEDLNYDFSLTSKDIGNTWLNYIFENRTVLWWGGIGNSVEHTAYDNLKRGIPAPESGSIKRNGPVMANQIGAQIFMDAYAMMCAGDPEKAVWYAGQCARVSHDGLAVNAAEFLAALEAMAFEETRLDPLFDHCIRYAVYPDLQKLIDDVRNITAKEENWRSVRDWMNIHYGYHRYPGSCPIIPNHGMVLASILCGGDDFQRSLMIAVSSGWDTDCNAANVGCFNGIRLGLKGIEAGADLRGPVNDRIYVVTADGGSCVSDAVLESRKIIKAAQLRNNCTPDIQTKRFAFEFSGSLQGFGKCPLFLHENCKLQLENHGNGLEISLGCLAFGCYGRISTPTFLDPSEVQNRETVASPTLYEGQEIQVAVVSDHDENPVVGLYICYIDSGDIPHILYGRDLALQKGTSILRWKIPPFGGMPICRAGLEFKSEKRFDGKIRLAWMDWEGAPETFQQDGILMKNMWDTRPFWSKAFVSGAQHFGPNLNHTYSISHNDGNGLATTGTKDFKDYLVASKLTFSLHKKAGLVIRSNGHRRFYGAVVENGTRFSIIKQKDDNVSYLASAEVKYQEFQPYDMELKAIQNHLSAVFNGVTLEAEDSDGSYLCGGTGFLIDTGTMFADGFKIQGQHEKGEI